MKWPSNKKTKKTRSSFPRGRLSALIKDRSALHPLAPAPPPRSLTLSKDRLLRLETLDSHTLLLLLLLPALLFPLHHAPGTGTALKKKGGAHDLTPATHSTNHTTTQRGERETLFFTLCGKVSHA